jgi:hypothetical protein
MEKIEYGAVFSFPRIDLPVEKKGDQERDSQQTESQE